MTVLPAPARETYSVVSIIGGEKITDVSQGKKEWLVFRTITISVPVCLPKTNLPYPSDISCAHLCARFGSQVERAIPLAADVDCNPRWLGRLNNNVQDMPLADSLMFTGPLVVLILACTIDPPDVWLLPWKHAWRGSSWVLMMVERKTFAGERPQIVGIYDRVNNESEKRKKRHIKREICLYSTTRERPRRRSNLTGTSEKPCLSAMSKIHQSGALMPGLRILSEARLDSHLVPLRMQHSERIVSVMLSISNMFSRKKNVGTETDQVARCQDGSLGLASTGAYGIKVIRGPTTDTLESAVEYRNCKRPYAEVS